jgi:hypothetical protein
MNECPSCGKELAKDMMFCPYCGTKILPESAPAAVNGPEQVEGLIPLAVEKGGNKDGQMFTLIITNSQLIVARVTEEDLIKVHRASGSVFLGGSILDPERHRKALGAYSRRYQMMGPEMIVAESEGNESLRLTEVKGIKLSSEEDAEGNVFYLISLDTQNGTRRYQIPTDKDSRDILISTFQEKVHW